MNADRPTIGWAKLHYSELYFLIAKFLEEGPCEKAAKVLRDELEEKELLVRGKTWQGEEKILSYDEIVNRNPHITPGYLPNLCEEFCTQLEIGGHCRQNGSHHSLVGNEISSFVCKNQSQTTGYDIHHVANQRYSFSNCHLPNYTSTNQCILLSAGHISPHFNHSLQFQQPQLYSHMKKQRVILGHLAPVFCIAYDLTSRRIITGADDDLAKVWSSHTGRLIATLRGHHAEITDISISRDNNMIATGSLDKVVRVWCGHSSAPLSVLCGHAGHITSVQFSPSPDEECRYLASTAKDGCLCFWKWDPESLKFSDTPIKFMEKNRISDQTLCSAFSPGGKFFVTGGTDRIVRIYQCNIDYPVLLNELSGHTDRIMTVQFSNTGQCMFATGSCDGTAIIWQYRTCQWSSIVLNAPVNELKLSKSERAYSRQVTMIGWERTDTYLVTAHTPDCHLRVWSSKNGNQVSLLEGHANEVFVVECHPKESRILLTAGHDGQVIIWDMFAGTKINVFQIEYENEGVPCIFDCKWSPDGLMCAAADSFGYLTLFGFGSSAPYEQHPDEQFFHTDYRPLMRDRNHFVIDEQSQLPPHLLPPPYLVDVDGHPHPLKYQEAILKFIRPSERFKQRDKKTDELIDYDEYMKKHFVKLKDNFTSNNRNRERMNVERRATMSSEIRTDIASTLPIEEDRSETDGFNQTTSTQGNASASVEELVDVMESDGNDQNQQHDIHNMLSSIVYSLGLSEEEARTAINHWHRRCILPALDSSLFSSEQAHLIEIREAENEWYQRESEKTIEISTPSTPLAPTPPGRALRSGRTIDTEEQVVLFSSSREGDSDRESDSDAEIPDEAWETNSTASSDISDWTNEFGYEISLSQKRSRRTRRRESAYSEAPSEMTIDEERHEEIGKKRNRKGHGSSSSEQTAAGSVENVRKKKKNKQTMKKMVKGSVDYSMYWPPDWLKMTKAQVTPYFPQVGDIVVYCYQGHDMYKEEVRRQKPYQWKNQQMPWQKYNLRPQEFCQVKNVHFIVGPPTLCSITLTLLPLSVSVSSDSGPSTSQKQNKPITFTFKYHDMDGSLDFLILDSIYKASLQRQWSPGDRFKSLIDGSYWTGTVLQRKGHHDGISINSYWQCYNIKWDDGATDQLSPWDMEIEDSPNELPQPLEDVVTLWGSEEEQKRILCGLERIMSELKEAEMFVNPVDLEEEFVYCTVVPFPTDLSTIVERLRNGFYRRKLALIWEVVLLHRNASSYNEEASLIVEHSKILTQILLKFINTPSCSDPLTCYQSAVNEDGPALDEVTAPEVDYSTLVDAEDVFYEEQVKPQRQRRIKRLSSDEEATDLHYTWIKLAEDVFQEIYLHENASVFVDPVDTEEYPDYTSIISCPMDLSIVNRKLTDGHYSTPAEFCSDMNLIFNNAKTYNQTRSQVYKMANQLQKIFNERASTTLKVSPNHHTHNYGTRKALEKIAMSLEEIESSSPFPVTSSEGGAVPNGHKYSDGSSEGHLSDTSYEEEEVEPEEVDYEEVEDEEEEQVDKVDLIMFEERMTRSKSRIIIGSGNESSSNVEKDSEPRKLVKKRKRKITKDTVVIVDQQMVTRSNANKRRRVLSYEELPIEDELTSSAESDNEQQLVVTRTGRVSHPRVKYY